MRSGTHRVEVLNTHKFSTLHEALRVTQDWVRVYHEERAHGATPPAIYRRLPLTAFKQKRRQLRQSL
ncbi:MAG: transposase [Pseudomonadales bacterium]|nr:transposase [Pseudomonadales bacterium]